MVSRALILLALAALTACAAVREAAPQPAERQTDIPRFFEGEYVTLEQLATSRRLALACARCMWLLDRELREPWIESRDARLLLLGARRHAPAEFELAETAWTGAEPGAAGADRLLFGEIGIYRPHRRQSDIGLRARPDSIEGHAAAVLRTMRDDTPSARILSGWRRLAPEVTGRGMNYLASAWHFSIGVETQLVLRDSLLGPFSRCGVGNAGSLSSAGPLADCGGFEMPAELLYHLLPGPALALEPLLRGLYGDAPLPRGFQLAPGPAERDTAVSAAALRALTNGACGVEYVPTGAAAAEITLSFLVDAGEARAEIALRREGFSAWTVMAVQYEAPASAGKRSPKLDLMPLLRARHGT